MRLFLQIILILTISCGISGCGISKKDKLDLIEKLDTYNDMRYEYVTKYYKDYKYEFFKQNMDKVSNDLMDLDISEDWNEGIKIRRKLINTIDNDLRSVKSNREKWNEYDKFLKEMIQIAIIDGNTQNQNEIKQIIKDEKRRIGME